MFSDPTKNIKTLGLRETDVVADLGAGTGFYSIAVGHIVQRGKVYAIEVVKDFLETITTKIREQKLDNVQVIWGNIEKIGGTKLQDNSVDAVIASNIFFQLEHKEKCVDEIKRILKKGGKALVIDWSADSMMASKGAIPKNKLKEMFESKDFLLEREIDAGAQHYGMILNKS